MLSVLRAFYAYRGRTVIAIGLLGFVFVFVLSLLPPRPGARHGLWYIYVLLFGFVGGIYCWTVDLSERRNLLWAQLPIPRRSLATGRLLVPLVVQLSISIAGFIGILAMQLVKGQADLMEAAFRVLSGQSLGLLLIYFVFFNEELSIALSRRRWLILTITIVLIPASIFLSFFTPILNTHETWPGIATFHAIAVFMALLSWFMFLRRYSFLVGINVWTGLPEDWSEE